jgi:hypothetical protein
VPNTGFLFQSSNGNLPPSVTAPANSASPDRWYRRNFGIRVQVTAGGRIGSFFFQTLILNLVSALALLAVSGTVLEFIVFSLCPLRGLYRQLKERETVKISELRKAGKENPEEYNRLIECVATLRRCC